MDGTSASYGIGREIETSRWYDFSNYDTGFEHDTCAADQNVAEISRNRQEYIRTPVFDDGPLLVSITFVIPKLF